eukprot:CAMPEP_0170543260 /NCGR_PEP_ID=MMETSP0211-20121228/2436_1 /TAXON_ID=311385 /ORGANISM="Pseudokeronopsis sp., Strain OXSARD2" /LENGTH=43 /DNA_ID= /DNA_START= /DNA_END= /DNA_ORIENTATION=
MTRCTMGGRSGKDQGQALEHGLADPEAQASVLLAAAGELPSAD